VTFGLAIIRDNHNYKTSPVYGSGFLIRIAERFLWVNEINFQNVHRLNFNYNIVNLSTGIVYGF